MGMAYVRIFYDWLETTACLDEAAKGRLIDAVVRYARDGEVVELPGNERFVFLVFQTRIDRDAEKYRQRCERGSHAYARVPLRNQELRSEESRNKESRNQELRTEESRNEEPTVLKNNNNWRTSAKARGAVAQLIVDAVLSEELACAGCSKLYELAMDGMESGLEPQAILDCCREADATNLGMLLYEAMQSRGLKAR